MGNKHTCMPLVEGYFISLEKGLLQFGDKEYSVIRELDDPRFELIQVLEAQQTKKHIYMKQRETDLSFDKLEEFKFRSQLSNTNLLDIYGYILKNELKDVCVYFEAFESDLEQEIRQALIKKHTIYEEQLITVLRCTLNALSYLQEHNIFHQYINPTQILKAGSCYKIHDNCLITKGKSLLKQGLRNQDLRYIAPEILEAISKKETDGHYNFFKADIYSLGICILDAGVLNHTDITLIDRKELKIVKENLEARIIYFASLYTPELSQILQEMLCFDPEKRPDSIQLFRRITTQWSGTQKSVLVSPINSSPEEISPLTRKITFKRTNSSIIKPQVIKSDIIAAHLQNGFPTVQNPNKPQSSITSKQLTPARQTASSLSKENDSRIPTPQRVQIDASQTKISSPIKNDPILSKIIQKMYFCVPTNENNANPVTEVVTKTESQALVLATEDFRTPLQRRDEKIGTFEPHRSLKQALKIDHWNSSNLASSNQFVQSERENILKPISKNLQQPKSFKTSSARYSSNLLSMEKRNEIPTSGYERKPKAFRLMINESPVKENKDPFLEKRETVDNRYPIKCLDMTEIIKTAEGLNSPLISPGSFFRAIKNYDPPLNGVTLNSLRDSERFNTIETENVCLIRQNERYDDVSNKISQFSSSAPHLQNLLKTLQTQFYTSQKISRNPLMPAQSISLATIDNQIKGLSNEELSKIAAEIKKEHKSGPLVSLQQTSCTPYPTIK